MGNSNERLERAAEDSSGLTEELESQYQRMRRDIRNPNSDFDITTLRYWMMMFEGHGETELVEIAARRIDGLRGKSPE